MNVMVHKTLHNKSDCHQTNEFNLIYNYEGLPDHFTLLLLNIGFKQINFKEIQRFPK